MIFITVHLFFRDVPVKPGSYVAFLPCRMQFEQKVMKQIVSLSIVSIAFDTAEMRCMNRDFTLRMQTDFGLLLHAAKKMRRGETNLIES